MCKMVSRKRQMLKLLLHSLGWTLAISILLQVQKLWYHDKSYLDKDNSETSSAAVKIAMHRKMAPFHPFEATQPKMLVIITYQRSGSTFFGRMLNQNPNVFYMFEPLDSFYSAYYGTPMKWNVPSDITSYSNGTQRFLPEAEIRGVRNFLAALFTCEVTSLPAETLIHPYLYYYKTDQFLGAAEYIKCIEKYESSATECSSFVPRVSCGGRFGEVSEGQLRQCHAALHDDKFLKKHSRKAEFEKYVACMRGLKKIVGRKCLAILEGECKKHPLRVVKTVRATMDVAESLLRNFTNLRIIHLMRDPRAVVRSRKEFDSSGRGLYTDLDENNTYVREAKIFCRTLTRDVRIRLELEKKFPGQIYPIIYDDLVRDLKQYTRKVYSFLGLDDPTGKQWWNESMGKFTSVDSIQKADNWQHVLSFGDSRNIAGECDEFFQLVDYAWH